MATLPIDLNRNSGLGRPLSFGEVDQNFNVINTSINNIQSLDNTISSDYTVQLSDAGKILLIDSSLQSIIITIPDDATTTFDIGQHIDIVQYGINSVTIAPEVAGVINSFNSKKQIAGKYVGVTIIKVAADEWLLIGNLI